MQLSLVEDVVAKPGSRRHGVPRSMPFPDAPMGWEELYQAIFPLNPVAMNFTVHGFENGPPFIYTQKLSTKRRNACFIPLKKKAEARMTGHLRIYGFSLQGKQGLPKQTSLKPCVLRGQFFHPTSHSPKSIRPSSLLSLGEPNDSGVIDLYIDNSGPRLS